MGFFKSDASLLGLLGKLRFGQLRGLLDTCCEDGSLNLPCCPSEKYTISLENTNCIGSSAYYTITITSNTTLYGVTTITVLGTNPTDGGGVFLNSADIVKDISFELENVELLKNTTMTIYIVDSRGNWSNGVTLTTANC